MSMVVAIISIFSLGIVSIIGASASSKYRETRFHGIESYSFFSMDKKYSESEHRLNALLYALSGGGYLSGVLELLIAIGLLIVWLQGGNS